MKKLLTFIICIAAMQIVKAQQAGYTVGDTSLVALNTATPVSAYQNVIYKRRLDSIQKEVPLDYNGYVQTYIDTYMSRRDEMGKILGLTRYYFPIYEKAFKDAGIPDEIKYLSIVESALNPNAISRVGAAGPWQFMSETAKIYGLTMNEYVDDRRDPIRASAAAAAYLKDAYQQFGDWLLAIASYNCGKSNVQHALEETGTHDYWSIRELLPAETRGYVPAFIAVNYVMNFYKRHNIAPQSTGLAIATDTISVNKFIPLSRISSALGMSYKDICVLNPAYRQQIINGSAASPRVIIVPQLDAEKAAALRAAIADPNSPVGVTRPIQYITLAQPKAGPMLIPANAAQLKPVSGEQNTARVIPLYHTTKKGETLGDIANKYGIKVEELIQLNKELGGSATVHLMPGLTVKLGRG